MHIEFFRNYCLQKKGVTECFPFNQEVLVFKVLDKMFALTNINTTDFKINLKCDPDQSIALRESHYQITPAFHMHKKHWNSVAIDKRLSRNFIVNLIDHSYDLVVSKMTKKKQAELKAM